MLILADRAAKAKPLSKPPTPKAKPFQQGNVNVPVAVWPYFDKVQLWLKHPIDRATIACLRKQCGHLYVGNYRARFDPSYRQRLEFKQPGDAALQWIARHDDALVNSIEIALDDVFANWRSRDDASDFLDYHLVRRWHGKQQIHRHSGKGNTRYDGWGARNSIVIYQQPFSRLTGERYVLHLEWRARGVRAVRSAGISSGQELPEFDHRKFWEKRLLLYTTTPERIGRYLRNRKRRSRSRTADPLDKPTGQIVLDSVDSMQELIDEYGKCLRIQRVMTKLSPENFLPQPDTLSCSNQAISPTRVQPLTLPYKTNLPYREKPYQNSSLP
jgi:hypothetical protein